MMAPKISITSRTTAKTMIAMVAFVGPVLSVVIGIGVVVEVVDVVLKVGIIEEVVITIGLNLSFKLIDILYSASVQSNRLP